MRGRRSIDRLRIDGLCLWLKVPDAKVEGVVKQAIRGPLGGAFLGGLVVGAVAAGLVTSLVFSGDGPGDAPHAAVAAEPDSEETSIVSLAGASSETPVPESAAVAIGPLWSGMDEYDLAALNLPFTVVRRNVEGDFYTFYQVTIGPNQMVEAQLDSAGKVDFLRTEARSVAAPGGGRPGDTLAQLKARYAGGEMVMGYADGLAANYVTNQDRVVFRFDPKAIGEPCIMEGRECPADMDRLASTGFYIY